MKLKGKVAVITGAGRGQGKAAARLFAREGAQVVVVDIDPEPSQEVVDLILRAGGEAFGVVGDVALVDDCEGIIREAVRQYGRLDILYNNAGIVDRTPNVDVREEQWDRMLDVNLKGPFFLSKFAVRQMRAQGTGGVVINTASAAGLVGYLDAGPYSAAKGGLIALSRQMAMDYAQEQIRVNVIAPGAIDTRLVRNRADFQKDPVSAEKNMVAKYPLGRMGTSEEVAQAALYLASDAAGWVTGIVLPVDGGYTAR